LSTAKSRTADMIHGPLGMKIFLFALPLAATGLLQQLFNAADVMVLGRFVGKNAMAAVGSNGSVISLLVNLFMGMATGVNVVVAQSTGRGEKEMIRAEVHTAVATAVIAGVLACAVGQAAAHPFLTFMGVPGEILPMSELYLRIYMGGMPIILLYNVEAAIFRSQGDTRTPLICLVFSGLLNIVMNLFFVLVMGMDVDGVAIATVASNGASALMLLIALIRSDGDAKLSLRHLRIDRRALRRILYIGIPSGLQGMVFSLSNVSIQSAVNSLGADVMAASSAAGNIEILTYYLENAFAQACATFVGQNYGAGERERCARATKLCLLQDLALTAVLSVIICVFRVPLLKLFNSDPAVVKYGSIRMIYLVAPYVFYVVLDVMSGCMRGYGFAVVPTVILIAGVCGLRILWVLFVFPHRPDIGTLMAAYPISWIVTAAVMCIAYVKMIAPLQRGAK